MNAEPTGVGLSQRLNEQKKSELARGGVKRWPINNLTHLVKERQPVTFTKWSPEWNAVVVVGVGGGPDPKLLVSFLNQEINHCLHLFQTTCCWFVVVIVVVVVGGGTGGGGHISSKAALLLLHVLQNHGDLAQVEDGQQNSACP